MTWTVEWSNVAEHDVLQMHWRQAGAICAAVRQFAETATGHIEVLRSGDPNLVALRVREGFALVRINPATRTIQVYRIYAAR
jgi:hypothetical protein